MQIIAVSTMSCAGDLAEVPIRPVTTAQTKNIKDVPNDWNPENRNVL